MFTSKNIAENKDCLRVSVDPIEAVIIEAALELLGLEDIETYLGYMLGSDAWRNFLKKKKGLEAKLERKFKNSV